MKSAAARCPPFSPAYVVAFLIYLMTTLYSVAVMRSVLEDKTNRIAEVLMSTIRAPHLIAGKIICVGSAAVAQVLIWVAIMAVVVTRSPRLGDRFGLPDAVVQALRVEPTTGILLFLFFLLAPLMFLESILNAPLGRTATTLGLIPLTASIANPMRMASTPVPRTEIAVSLVLLVSGIAPVAWVARKSYRVGILSNALQLSNAHLAARDQIEHVAVVPGDDRRTAAVDVVRPGIRAELIHAGIASENPRDERIASVRHRQREPSGFVRRATRLTHHEIPVMRLARSVRGGQFPMTMVADVDAD